MDAEGDAAPQGYKLGYNASAFDGRFVGGAYCSDGLLALTPLESGRHYAQRAADAMSLGAEELWPASTRGAYRVLGPQGEGGDRWAGTRVSTCWSRPSRA